MYEPRRDPGYLIPPDDDGIDWDTLKEHWAERYEKDALDAILDHCLLYVPSDLDDAAIRRRLRTAIEATCDGYERCQWAANLDNSDDVTDFERWAESELAGEHHIPLEDEDRP